MHDTMPTMDTKPTQLILKVHWVNLQNHQAILFAFIILYVIILALREYTL